MANYDSKTQSNADLNKTVFGKKRFLIPTVIVVFLAAIAVAYWFMFLRAYQSTDDAYIDSDPVSISSKILGRISSLAVDEGDSVGQAQLLVQLDSTDLKAQEAQAMAGLEYARQNVPLAGINLQRAHDDFERASLQIKDKVITREQFDHTRKALEIASAQNDVALSQVKASQAQLDVIQAQLKNTQILAPISGIVAKKWVMPGDIVQAGQPIFTIYDLKNVWITANFEETKIASIYPGASVRISVDAYPGRDYEGKVLMIGSAAASQFSLIPPNNASGNFTKITQRIPVKISLINYDPKNILGLRRLLPGMSVVVKVSKRK